MKSSVNLVAAIATVSLVHASAIPRASLSDVSSTANGMEDVISGKAKCASVGVIFARGTFDDGNIGFWVGPNLQAGLAKISSVAFQGVDASVYKADLQGYIGDGGSNTGAASLASTVTSYVKACPESAVVITGWSQGALVAHKGLGKLSPATLKKVAGLVTFGDPEHLFDNTPVPSSVAFKSFCITGTDLDPLCASVPGDFKLPTSVNDIVGPFRQLPTLAQGTHEAASAAILVKNFPGQLASAWRAFASTLLHGRVLRLMLTPQHFTYGNNGMATQAAEFIAGLPAVKAAVAGSERTSTVGAKTVAAVKKTTVKRSISLLT